LTERKLKNEIVELTKRLLLSGVQSRYYYR